LEWDWGSYGWGIVTGVGIMVVVGGVVLYLAWPKIAGIVGLSALLPR